MSVSREWLQKILGPRHFPANILLQGPETEAPWCYRYLSTRAKASCNPDRAPTSLPVLTVITKKKQKTTPGQQRFLTSWKCCLEKTPKWIHPFSYQPSRAVHSSNSTHKRRNNFTKMTPSKELCPNHKSKRVQNCVCAQSLLQSPRPACWKVPEEKQSKNYSCL